MDPISEAVWPYFVALCIGLVAFSYTSDKRRTAKLKRTAEKLGYNFSESGRDETLKRHNHFELFGKGYGRKVYNELWKTDNGNDVSIFRYRYAEDPNGSSRNQIETVLSIRSDQLNAPAFSLDPEYTHILQNLVQELGYQKVDFNFDEFPKFSKEYILRGQDEAKVREFFTPGVLKFFENNLQLCVEAKDDTLILYKHSRGADNTDIKKLYALGKRVLSTLS